MGFVVRMCVQARCRHGTRPDQTVDKFNPDGAVMDTFAPVQDRGKFRVGKVKLVPNSAPSAAVSRRFEGFVGGGWGLTEIARALDRKGVSAPRERKRLQGSVRGALLNPAFKEAVV